MKHFMTRIVLHNCDATDYEKLHQAMRLAGFSTSISSEDKTYHLPEAEYYISGSESTTSNTICNQAKMVARSITVNRIGKSYSVLVTGPNDLVWYNLGRADPL